MKYSFYIFLIVLMSISCGKEKTVSDELLGVWQYERETFQSNTAFEDPDVAGVLLLRADGTGFWISSTVFKNDTFQWELLNMDAQIKLTIDPPVEFFSPKETIYDLTRNNENSFTLTFEEQSDGIEKFENIILTRVE